MLAAFACDLLGPQAGQPRFAPQLFGFRLMAGSLEHLAAQHHRHGDIADFRDAEP